MKYLKNIFVQLAIVSGLLGVAYGAIDDPKYSNIVVAADTGDILFVANCEMALAKLANDTTKEASCDFPFTDTEKKHFAILKVDDLTREEVDELKSFATTTNELGEEVQLDTKKYKLDLDQILTTKQKADLADETKLKDLRDKTTDISTAIIKKWKD